MRYIFCLNLFWQGFLYYNESDPFNNYISALYRPARYPFCGRGSRQYGSDVHPSPAAAELKFLLDFYTKKSRVQGSALSLPADRKSTRLNSRH